MANMSIEHTDLITIGKRSKCKGFIKRLRYGDVPSEYVICTECTTVYFKPNDETLEARPIRKIVGRIPIKQEMLPKLGPPYKKKEKKKEV